MVSTIFGQRYLQLGREGVAAYHFDSPSDAYISYANAPEEWKLDDGCSPPLKTNFVDTSIDPDTRTFKGTILSEDSPFAGATKWEYTMIFSEDYSIIEGGSMFDGSPHRSEFPKDLCYWRSVLPLTGVTGQVYVQSGVVGLASYHFEDMGRPYVSYEEAPEGWRMDDGTELPLKKFFDEPRWDQSTRTWTGIIDWDPKTMSGDSRWVYNMIFSDDFKTIEGGECRAYGPPPGREQRNTLMFGTDLRYSLFDEGEAQMIMLLKSEED